MLIKNLLTLSVFTLHANFFVIKLLIYLGRTFFLEQVLVFKKGKFQMPLQKHFAPDVYPVV
jgi:hypothetical protein